ncbi:MAG TPA: L-histidine N(alpha)-methyltransferase, partial [Solirubrobacteraceae bacterium]|nr:L-histidine N(alpha)-methyltransferase [Solirubrobacteraceae bacterium]
MNPLAELTDGHPAIRIDVHVGDGDGAERRLADDVLDGLTQPFKEIPPKHFYDSRGSALFERICGLPEYYPTRTEMAILEESAAAIVDAAASVELVELGSGATAKARLLLDAMG